MRRAMHDLAALVGRAVLGVIFIGHGWDKFQRGVAATERDFAAMRVPMPKASAVFAITAELGGGILIALGLLTVLAGMALVAVMAGAFAFVQAGQGFAALGFELVLALGALALLLAVAGAGRVSLDHLLFGRRKRAKTVVPVPQPA